MPDAEAAGAPDAGALSTESILARARGENFPVAPHPSIPLFGRAASLRSDLYALYGFARLVDQLGDDADGDRIEQLESVSRDLHRLPHAEPEHPILRRLSSVIRRHGLPLSAFERLIEANRRDQTLREVRTWDELVDGCTRSANPVGELVLGVLEQASPETIRFSDSICTGLQVVEHCQDVAEDLVRGRIYLPADDRQRFGCDRTDLSASHASPGLERVIRLEVERARTLLRAADSLLPRLRGIGIPLVAGYAAGGFATCDALERNGFDVLGTAIKPARRDVVRHWMMLVWRALRSRGGR